MGGQELNEKICLMPASCGARLHSDFRYSGSYGFVKTDHFRVRPLVSRLRVLPRSRGVLDRRGSSLRD